MHTKRWNVGSTWLGRAPSSKKISASASAQTRSASAATCSRPMKRASSRVAGSRTTATTATARLSSSSLAVQKKLVNIGCQEGKDSTLTPGEHRVSANTPTRSTQPIDPTSARLAPATNSHPTSHVLAATKSLKSTKPSTRRRKSVKVNVRQSDKITCHLPLTQSTSKPSWTI